MYKATDGVTAVGLQHWPDWGNQARLLRTTSLSRLLLLSDVTKRIELDSKACMAQWLLGNMALRRAVTPLGFSFQSVPSRFGGISSSNDTLG